MTFSKDYFDANHSLDNGWPTETTVIIAQLDRIIELLEELNKGPFDVTIRPKIDVQAMQVRADSNRDNAATLYGDVLYYGCFRPGCNGRNDGQKCHAGEDRATAWRRRDNGKRVVFTPYGWVDEPV